MKKFYKMMCIATVMMVVCSGCSSKLETKNKTYKPYGLLNKEETRDPKVQYELCVGNLILGCILVETIVAPIYFFGFDLFEPTGMKAIEK